MLERFSKDPKFMMNVFETMKEGLVLLNEDGIIFYFNKAAEEITGFRNEEVLGKQCTILDSDTCVVMTGDGKQKNCSLFKDGTICNKRCRIRAKDGRMVYLLKNAVVLRDDNGEIIGAVETMTDITSLYLKQVELEELKEELRQEYWFMGLLGRSPAMQRLYEQVRNAAGSEAPVVITGESGTGKDLVANAIHKLSRRKDGPCVKMNCASLNEHLLESELFGHKKGSFTGAISDRLGRFEASSGGSIFLDEIGDMPPSMQAKLLRVIENKEIERVGEHKAVSVDIRLISATNKELKELVSSGSFREDLYYRVNSICIKTPALRERPDDIPILVAHYLKKISAINNKSINTISPRAMDLLAHYSWPGNVRQLINALEHCAVTCKGDTVKVSDLPEYLFDENNASHGDEHASQDGFAMSAASAGGRQAYGRNVGFEDLKIALSLFDGHKTKTAKHLGISRVTLWKKLKEYGLE